MSISKRVQRIKLFRSGAVAVATLIGLIWALNTQGMQSRLVWDDFKDGFSVRGSDAKWFHFAFGPYIGNDGTTSVSARGLKVRAGTENGTTGYPTFSQTLAQEGVGNNPAGIPGSLDHVKWLVYMNHVASTGFPGFDAVSGEVLVFETWLSGRTYGTEAHPFGQAVQDAEDDVRLACVSMNVIDFDTMMVFDFFLSNRRIYALYERLPFRRDVYGRYAAFSYLIPVAERNADEWHHLSIAYDKAGGIVRWLIDNVEVFRVDRIGYRIDRRYMLIDHGGTEQLVRPNQLNAGMGMLTLLDGYMPVQGALVRLSNATNFYFDPEAGEPTPLMFYDEVSMARNRLFGQGAEFKVKRYVVRWFHAGS